MRRVVNNRTHLFMACLLVGLVTLLSHSLKVEIGQQQKVNAGQNSGSTEKVVVITPSVAVTVNFFTLQVDGFLELTPLFQPVEKAFKIVPLFQRAASAFQQTLFRFIISPNAP